MTVPNSQEDFKLKKFHPPAWMVNQSKEKAARSGLAQTTSFADGKAVDKATLPEFAGKLAELRAKKKTDPTTTTQLKTVEHGDIEQPPPTIVPPPKILEQVKEARRELHVQKRDERRGKKEKVRTRESATAPKKERLNSANGESSTAGASREAAAAVTPPTVLAPSPSPSLFVSEHSKEGYRVPPVLPAWYVSITDTRYEMKELAKKTPQAVTSLNSLKGFIGDCEKAKPGYRQEKLYDQLRDSVHRAEILLTISPYILRKVKILHPEYGLPRIFKEEADFPSDLKADSYQLYTRWYREDFQQDILRGIVTVKGQNRSGDHIDPIYRKKHPANPKFYGAGDLVIGQWWPTQLCLVRDGAHGAAQGGIFGEKDKGAYSIVLSGSSYDDQDDGDVIEYCGTEGKEGKPTENTRHMMLSHELGNPIRVIRSHNLGTKSKYRPELGFRYDGLYKIVSYEPVEKVDKKKAMYRFRLTRIEGQEPIRCENNAARRPTVYEIGEYKKLKIE